MADNNETQGHLVIWNEGIMGYRLNYHTGRNSQRNLNYYIKFNHTNNHKS